MYKIERTGLPANNIHSCIRGRIRLAFAKYIMQSTSIFRSSITIRNHFARSKWTWRRIKNFSIIPLFSIFSHW